MALEKPEQLHRWLHPKPGPVHHVIVCGPIETYRVHWVQNPLNGRALGVRCRQRETDLCRWCLAGGNEPRARYVVPLLLAGSRDGKPPLTPSSNFRLIELGREHYPILAAVEQGGATGAQLQLSRPEQGTRADLRIALLTRDRITLEPHQVLDVAEYVASLGLSELRSLGVEVLAGSCEERHAAE